MAASSFLTGPQDNLSIVSWNINSVKTKVEKRNVELFLSDYDIVCLNEIKTCLPVLVPGYVSYISFGRKNSNRGGTCLIIKQCLNKYIVDVDTSIADQVWFRLMCVPGVLFGACYVPPSDSQYFNYASISNIQEKIKCSNGSKCIVFGDLNTRLGVAVRELPGGLGMLGYSYPNIPDPVPSPNDNATAVLGICVEEELFVVNNLKTPDAHFPSKRTFRRGGEWISELDTCTASKGLIKFILHFDVLHDNSLPSDHAPIMITLKPPTMYLESLLSRARDLGEHGAEFSTLVNSKNIFTKRPIKFSHIDVDKFSRELSEHVIDNNLDGNIDTTIMHVSETLYNCALKSRLCENTNERLENYECSRWDRILEERDHAKLWQAIDWRGEFRAETGGGDCKPGDEEFKDHFEKLFNSADAGELDANEFYTEVTIPVLDEPISTVEVETQIKKLKSNKACGPDGVPPGLFKILPIEWVMYISILFNSIFLPGTYPICWTTAKLFTIFKRGLRDIPDNYRAISVMNSIAKIYDMILSSRLSQWFRPYREQAGSQAGRGCIEHLVALRLLLDCARRKKLKLFVTFVDFKKAYDFVPRNKLFATLKQMGCGLTMLTALVAMYKCTGSVIGTALLMSTIGVRQGSPTSCILFVLYINDMIRMIKQRCQMDGFLAWLHVMVLMDDTILLSTTKIGMKRKLEILYDFCDTYGMIINSDKTKFMVVNGNDEDREPIVQNNNAVIHYCNQYIYLGSPFTDDGSATTAIKIHASSKMCHTLKYVSFVGKNNDVPFIVKRKVFDAALMSTLLYGCESWLDGNLKPVEKQYKWCIKQLLGVRKTTNNDLCMAELGLPVLRVLVKAKQRKFFKKMWLERNSMTDDPLIHVLKIAIGYNDARSRYIMDLITNDYDDILEDQLTLKMKIRNSLSNRVIFYRSVNPELEVHELYLKSSLGVKELERISWTKLRLSAHSLAIEKGRWNRRGRGSLPWEERLCSCGQVQTEKHIIENCPVSLAVRRAYAITSVNDLMVNRDDYASVCSIVHELLSLY